MLAGFTELSGRLFDIPSNSNCLQVFLLRGKPLAFGISVRCYALTMARMNRPAPVEITYKNMRFLITHNPTNATLNKFIEVSLILEKSPLLLNNHFSAHRLLLL